MNSLATLGLYSNTKGQFETMLQIVDDDPLEHNVLAEEHVGLAEYLPKCPNTIPVCNTNKTTSEELADRSGTLSLTPTCSLYWPSAKVQ